MIERSCKNRREGSSWGFQTFTRRGWAGSCKNRSGDRGTTTCRGWAGSCKNETIWDRRTAAPRSWTRNWAGYTRGKGISLVETGRIQQTIEDKAEDRLGTEAENQSGNVRQEVEDEETLNAFYILLIRRTVVLLRRWNSEVFWSELWLTAWNLQG